MNESLTYATVAFEHLEGPFRFIRLVQKHVKESALQTATPDSAIRLPSIKLWDLVQHKVTDLELCAAECSFMLLHACADCIRRGDVRNRAGSMKRWAKMLDCKECADRMNCFYSFGHSSLLKVRYCTQVTQAPSS